MPKRRGVAVAVVAVAVQLSTDALEACPFAQFKPSCELIGDRLSNDPESYDRRIAALERELARRPTPGAFRDLNELLENRFYWNSASEDREFRDFLAERGRLVDRWIRAFSDDPHATLASYVQLAQTYVDDKPVIDRLSTLRAAHTRFPDFVPIATELVRQLVDYGGTEQEARALVHEMLARDATNTEALHLLFELEWTADRYQAAGRALGAWRELAPADPKLLFHAIVFDEPRLDDAELDTRLADLFDLEGDVLARLALCEHLGERASGCERRALARWDPRRAEAPERRAAFWHMRTAESVDAGRFVLELERDPDYRAKFMDHLFDLALDGSRCDVARDLLELLDDPTEDDRNSLSRRCDEPAERDAAALARARALLAERPQYWDWRLKKETPTDEIWSAVRAELARRPTDRDLWDVALEWASAESQDQRASLLEAWIAADPSAAWPRELLAREKADQGDSDELVELLEAKLEGAQKVYRRHDVLDELFSLQLERGQLSEMRERAIASLAGDDEIAWAARVALARADLAEGRPEAALQWLEGDPANRFFWDVVAERARALERLSRFEDAEAAWREVDRSGIYDDVDLAELALAHDSNTTAARFIRRALASDPDQPELWAAIGDLAQRTTRPKLAEFAYSRALALRYDEPKALDGMLSLLVESKRLDEAASLVRGTRRSESPRSETLRRAAEQAERSERSDLAELFREAAERAAEREPKPGTITIG